MNLWRCSKCAKVGLWGPKWGSYVSLEIEENFPRWRIVGCSLACMEGISQGLENGTIRPPKLSRDPYRPRITRAAVGYQPQPPQPELIEVWNREHPNDCILQPLK